MKSLTKEQAKHFVLSGYIPTSVEDICDVQDIFGHQIYWDNMELMINQETRENAFTLFRAIWSKDEMDRYEEQIKAIDDAKTRYTELQKELTEIEKKYGRWING